jgi:hypothetical protein
MTLFPKTPSPMKTAPPTKAKSPQIIGTPRPKARKRLTGPAPRITIPPAERRPVQPQAPSREVEALRIRLGELESELEYLDDEYSTLGKNEKKEALQRYRDKHDAPKTSNVNHLKTILRDKIQNIQTEIDRLTGVIDE